MLRDRHTTGVLGALIVSMDFATSVIPGWHTTIFPPYFVSGRSSRVCHGADVAPHHAQRHELENYIHVKHVEYMNIVIIVTGSIVGVAYLTELFISWYSGVEYEATPSSTALAALTAGRTG